MYNIKFCQWLDSNPGPLDRKQPLYQLSHNHCRKKCFVCWLGHCKMSSYSSRKEPNLDTLVWGTKSLSFKSFMGANMQSILWKIPPLVYGQCDQMAIQYFAISNNKYSPKSIKIGQVNSINFSILSKASKIAKSSKLSTNLCPIIPTL